MDAFTVYKTYLALRAHFTTDNYDIFEKQGRIRASKQAFARRKDLFSMEKLSRKYKDAEIVNLLVANFVTGNKWGGAFDTEAHDTYLVWLGRQERLNYMFNTELDALQNKSSNWSDLLRSVSGNHPYIIRAYLGSQLSIETLTILDLITEHSISNLDLNDTIIWPSIQRIVRKYAPFLIFEHEQYRKDFGRRFRIESAKNSVSGGTDPEPSGPDFFIAGQRSKSNARPKRYSTMAYQTGTEQSGNYKTSKYVALSDYFQ